MLRTLLVSSCMLLGLGGLANAADMVVREWAVETSIDVTPLPATVPTRIDARQCSSCDALTLDVTAQTRFFLASGARMEEVSLTMLKKASSTDRPVGIFYSPRSKEVTRIVIFRVPAELLSAAQPTDL